MKEEIFDVCNERDEVIGRNSRAEVHRLGLRHRAVHVLVFNSRGEVFLQKRSMSKDTFPGAWDSSAAGHLDSGEDYDACAVREMREELGIVAESAPERLFKMDACSATGQEHVWVYKYQCDGPLCLNPEELEGGEWFSVARVNEWLCERPEDFASALALLWPKAVQVLRLA